MQQLTLERPAPWMREEAMAFLQELAQHGETVLHGGLFLQKSASYAAWLDTVERFKDPATTPEGYVAQQVFFALCKPESRLIGVISYRTQISEYMEQFGGHIAYHVRPSERGQGYGKAMLAQALCKCWEAGLSRVLITCDQSNTASAHVIRAAGGILEDVRIDPDGIPVERYYCTR